jgi:hypothetical protein
MSLRNVDVLPGHTVAGTASIYLHQKFHAHGLPIKNAFIRSAEVFVVPAV